MRFKNRKRAVFFVAVIAGVVSLACSSATTPTPTGFQASTPVAPPPAAAAPTAEPAQPVAAVAPDPEPTAPAAQTDTQPESSEADGGFAWAIEDVDRGTKPALALTSDGTPYVAYMLESMPGFVNNAIKNGDSWDITNIVEGYYYGPLDIAIGPDDTAHVAYHDHQGNTFNPSKGDAVYAVLRDGAWTTQDAVDPGHDGWDNRITVDADGRPHMSGVDPEEFGGDGVEYYRLNDSGEWEVESVGSGPLTYKYATSVAVTPDGIPHVSYFAQPDNNLIVASKNGSGWELDVVDSTGDAGLFSALLADNDGGLHISYLQRTSNTSGMVKYAFKAAGSAEWEITELDVLDKLSFGFVGARNITSVALDSNRHPWIAYSDEKNLKLAIWNGREWLIESVVDAGSSVLGQLVVLKLDANDEPHLTYFEVTDKSPLAGLVKYAKGTPN